MLDSLLLPLATNQEKCSGKNDILVLSWWMFGIYYVPRRTLNGILGLIPCALRRRHDVGERDVTGAIGCNKSSTKTTETSAPNET